METPDTPRFTIPHTDLNVFPLCMGVADIGVKGSEEEGHQLLDEFVAAGGDFIDTARIYSDWIPGEIGRSERVLGDWIASRNHREKLTIATKGGHPPLSDMSQRRLSASELAIDVEKSLRALRIDQIDLYWLHRDNPERPVSEILDTMSGFVERGFIRYWGVSNWKAPRIREAVTLAREKGLPPPVANQPLWNIGTAHKHPSRDKTMASMDAEMMQVHQEFELTCIPYSSQANGFFSKLAKAGGDLEAVSKSSYATPENLEIYRRLKALSEKNNVPVSHLVIAWMRAQPIPVVPLFSCRNRRQLHDTLAAVHVQLTAEEANDLTSKPTS